MQGNEEIYIMMYGLLVLWINIDYVRDYKNIKEGLADIAEEDELGCNPGSLSIMFLGLTFNFFRRWLIYLFAIFIIQHIVVIIVAAILFIISLYDTLFNYSLSKVKKSNIGLYVVIVDTILIALFIVYLFMTF